jgi:hypothetical protein
VSLAPSQLFSSVDAGDAVLTPSQIDRRHKKERLRGEELGESNTSTPQEVLWNGQARGRLESAMDHEGMQTLTPTRAYHDQRGRDRRAPAPQGPARQVSARGASALARERAYAAAPAPAPAGDSEADWDAGFDMFVEKCSDGTETDSELRRRWDALSDARQSTWARLARLRSSLVPLPGEGGEAEPAPAPQPQPQSYASQYTPPVTSSFETPVRRAREAVRPHSAQFPVERPSKPVTPRESPPPRAAASRQETSPPRVRAKALPVTHPNTTMIFLDWDDTLYPTAALLDGGYLVERFGQLVKPQPFPPSVQEELDQLQDSAERFMETASRFGQIVLITNAAQGWVDQSSKLAAPRMAETLRRRGIKAVYARGVDNAEQRWDNPARWKAAAFIREADATRAALQKQSGGGGGSSSARQRAPALNIVSIGDALFERVASHAAARVWDLVKTVKLLDNPEIKMVRDQLDMLNEVLGDLCANTKSEDMDMSTGDGGDV